MADAAPTQQVPVVGPDGAVGTVAKADLRQAIAAGATLATPEDVRKERMEAEYGGLGGGAAAFGLGALRGASLGLSDPLIAGIGGERARTALAGYQETNPTASFGGELAGVVAPAILSGGEGAVGTAARWASAPVRAVGAVGGAVERGALRVLGGEATSVLGRVGQRALTSALGTAAEGAVYGVGSENSDAAIHNHELTAEKLWAGAGQGALLGAGFGAAAGTLGQLTREAGGALVRSMEGSSLGSWIDRKSLEATGRAAGVNKRIATKAERYGDFDEMRRIWRDEAPGLAGKRSFSNMATEDLAAAAAKGIERDGAKIGSALDAADQAILKKSGPEGFARAVDVINDLERAADRVVTDKLGSKPLANKLIDLADHARQMTGLVDAAGQYVPGALESRWSTRQVQEFRVMVDKAIGDFGPELKGYKSELLGIRRDLEKRVTDAVESVGQGDAYKAAKQKYQAWRTLQDAVKNAQAGSSSNRFFGLSEQLGGMVGSQIGGLVGGPVGSLIGTGVAGLAAHAVRTRGDFLAADLLKKVSTLGALQQATNAVDGRIHAGIRNFLAAAPQKAAAAMPSGLVAKDDKADERAIAQAQFVQHLAANDTARNEHVTRMLGDMGTYAPQVTAHAAIKAHSMILNLAANAPKASVNATSMTPHLEKLRYSPIEVHRFMIYSSGVHDPLSILGDMKAGHVSPDKARAVRENHPELFAEMQTQLWQMAQDQQHPLDWEQKKIAKFTFGVDTDSSLTDDAIRANQDSAAKGGQPVEPNQPGPQPQDLGSRRPLNLDMAPMMQTPTEAIATPI